MLQYRMLYTRATVHVFQYYFIEYIYARIQTFISQEIVYVVLPFQRIRSVHKRTIKYIVHVFNFNLSQRTCSSINSRIRYRKRKKKKKFVIITFTNSKGLRPHVVITFSVTRVSILLLKEHINVKIQAFFAVARHFPRVVSPFQRNTRYLFRFARACISLHACSKNVIRMKVQTLIKPRENGRRRCDDCYTPLRNETSRKLIRQSRNYQSRGRSL